MPTTILTGGTGYSEPTGSWGGSLGTERYTNAGPASAQFAFTGLAPGTAYALGLEYNEFTNRVTNAAWSVSGTSGTPSGTINEQDAVTDFAGSGTSRVFLPQSFTPTGTTLTLTLSYPASPAPAGNYVDVVAGYLDLVSNVSPIPAAQDGNWSVGSTWLFGAVPSGSKFALVNRGHTVTVAADATVGDGTSSTVLDCTGGFLDIAAGVAFTIRGGTTPVGTPGGLSATGGLTLGAGASLLFDANAGVTPTLQLSRLAVLACNGTSGARCTLATKSGSAGNNAFLSSHGLDTSSHGLLTATYTDFLRLGTSSQNWITASLDAATDALTLAHCTVDSSGALAVATTRGDTTISLLNCVITNTAGTGAFSTSFGVALTTGTRSLSYCSIDKLFLVDVTGLTFNECYLVNPTFRNSWASWAGGLLVNDAANDSLSLAGDATDPYSVNPAAANAHSLTVPSGGTLAGAIFEAPNDTSTVGDFVFLGGTGAQTVTGCLLLPSAASGHSPGKLISCIDNASTSGFLIHATHNTVCSSADGGEQGVVAIGENYDGHAGMVAEMKSNLAWSPAAGNGTILSYQGVSGSPVAGVIATGACDYNGRYNLGPGNRPIASPVSGYYDANTGEMFTGGDVPDGHGVAANPQFVDPARHLIRWADTFHGPATTLDEALAVVANDPTRIPALRSWVRGGFAPTNVAYHGTAHDGTDIGAVAYQAPATAAHALGLLGVGS